MIVKVDLDGVIGNNVEMFCRYVRENYEIDFHPKDVEVYNFDVEEIGLSVGDIVHEIYQKEPSMLLEMGHVEGSLEALERINQEHEIKIVTHRPEIVRDETREWLESKNFSYNELIVDAPRDKSRVEGDVLIDDSSKVLEKFEKSRKEAILFPRNYNKQEIPRLNFVHHPHKYSDKSTEQIIEEESQWDVIEEIIEQL